MAIRSKPMSHKQSGLPLGVSESWCHKKGRRPYLEFQVYYKDDAGNGKIKHFYVGTEPTDEQRDEARAAAIKFRLEYEQGLVS